MTARAYLRTDPGIWRRKVVEQRYPAALFAAFQAVLCLAEEQPDRGRFRSERLLRLLLDEPKDGVRVLWGRHVTELVRRGDLVRLADGTLYVDGWDEWQEGDVTVRERMQRLRDRRKRYAAGDGDDRNDGDGDDRNGSPVGTVTVPSRVRDPRDATRARSAAAVSGSGSGGTPPTPAERGQDGDDDGMPGGTPRSNGTNPRAVAAREAQRRRDLANDLQLRYLRGELTADQHRQARADAGLPS